MMNPELLLPAGDSIALKTAVDNGADAVYVGASSFSARAGAVNFSESELSEAVSYAHERSSRIYLALNTLIADDELADALKTAVFAASCGVDALIMQDIGLAGLIHEALPDMPLHASTQMTIYDESAFRALYELGFRRVILPRELSLPEIARITRVAHDRGMETEMFIHGALCVCFSGQCLFSSLTGGRSGNRGACAQPCRLAYRIHENDRALPTAACLSPKDQSALRQIDAVRQTGVDSLKIEGRMRQASYVGQTAAVYRARLDSPPGDIKQLEAWEKRLLLAFNRGGAFTDRAFSGRKDASFLSGPTVGSFGVPLGIVVSANPRSGTLTIRRASETESPGKGDFLSIRRPDDPDAFEPVGRLAEVASAPIGTVEEKGADLAVRGFHPDVLARLEPGDRVFRMNDARQDQVVLTAKTRRTDISWTLAPIGEPVLQGYRLTATVVAGPFAQTTAIGESDASMEALSPLEEPRVLEQLAKTGATPFRVVRSTVPDRVRLTIAELNRLRRDTLTRLSGALSAQNRRIVPVSTVTSILERLRVEHAVPAHDPKPVEIAAFFYQWPSSGEPLACGADAYLLPAEGLERPESRHMLARLRQEEPHAGQVLVLPPAAAGSLAQQLRQWQEDGTLSHFDRLCGGHPGLPEITGQLGIGFESDSTANIYNHLSVIRSAASGAAVTTVSPELSDDQLLALARSAYAAPGVKPVLEWFVYGRHRLMYSAFCPVGHNVPGCRRCAGKDYQLSDRKGRVFPLLLHPPYCTAVILQADMIRPPANLPELMKQGPSRLRLLFYQEDRDQRRHEISRIRQLYAKQEKMPGEPAGQGEKSS